MYVVYNLNIIVSKLIRVLVYLRGEEIQAKCNSSRKI